MPLVPNSFMLSQNSYRLIRFAHRFSSATLRILWLSSPCCYLRAVLVDQAFLVNSDDPEGSYFNCGCPPLNQESLSLPRKALLELHLPSAARPSWLSVINLRPVALRPAISHGLPFSEQNVKSLRCFVILQLYYTTMFRSLTNPRCPISTRKEATLTCHRFERC